MFYLFMFFATVGGAVMALQLVMTLIGLGAEGMDADVHDVDFGDLAGGHDIHIGGHDGDFHDAEHPDSTHGFKVLSVRTIIAAVTFFGLGGLLAQAGGMTPFPAILVALGSGGAAMGLVYKLYATLYAMQSDGSVRIDAAVGCYGTVYVPIPAEDSGAGKALINVQGRTMEYQAVTPGEKLPSGVRVVVTRVVTNNTIEVESAIETTASDQADEHVTP